MVVLSSLWLPILLSTVFVFIASFLMWVVLPHHKSDWKEAPDEEGLRRAANEGGLPPGQYVIPYCVDTKEMNSPEMVEKYERGPNVFLTVKPPGKPGMGKNLVLTFIYYLVISIFIAYLAGNTLAPDADYLSIFRVTGTAGVLAHCAAVIPNAIWFGRTWSSALKEVGDGIVYALLIAGTFGWLWS